MGEGMVFWYGGDQCVNRNSISFVRRMETHPGNPTRHWTSPNEALLYGRPSRRPYEWIGNPFGGWMDVFMSVPRRHWVRANEASLYGRLSRRPYEWIGKPFHLDDGCLPGRPEEALGKTE
jgi:hypothetical protein